MVAIFVDKLKSYNNIKFAANSQSNINKVKCLMDKVIKSYHFTFDFIFSLQSKRMNETQVVQYQPTILARQYFLRS